MRIRNDNPFTVSGKAVVKDGTHILGTVSYKAAGKRTTAVRMTVTSTVRRNLAKRKAAQLTVTISGAAASGATRTATVKRLLTR